MRQYLKWAQHEHGPGQRLVVLLILAPIFLVLIPWALLVWGRVFDVFIALPLFWNQWWVVGGLVLGVPGLLFAGWTVLYQLIYGQGTPVPTMPTQRLLVEGPYSYCRNPMILGTILFYLGVAIGFGSHGAGGLVAMIAIALLSYAKLIEEEELEMRFGKDYLAYKARTPFILPKLW